MGLFDFLKPKKDPIAEIGNDTRFLPLITKAHAQKIAAQSSNLKSVGREAEARQLVGKFLADVGRDCLKENHRENTAMLTALADSAIHLGEAKCGKQILDKIIEFHEELQAKGLKAGPAMDLTQPYIDAGRLAHQMRESRDEEYRCFWLAAEAKPPHRCKVPATARQKAVAHNFACSLCGVEASRDTSNSNEWVNRAAWHDTKRREFAPECNWDDMLSMIAWLKSDEEPQ